jgi:hypothetical protein
LRLDRGARSSATSDRFRGTPRAARPGRPIADLA